MIIVVSGPENMSIKKNFAINQKIKRGGVNSNPQNDQRCRYNIPEKVSIKKNFAIIKKSLILPWGISNLWWPSTKMIIELEWIGICRELMLFCNFNPFE